jgi:hypothetical protein
MSNHNESVFGALQSVNEAAIELLIETGLPENIVTPILIYRQLSV